MLEMGLGGAADIPAAIRAYRRAAEGRSHQARFNLGRVLLEGRGPQGPDPLMAAMWLELAAMARHEGAAALLAGLDESVLDARGRDRARRLALAWR
jgi:TPR repeat protein